MTLVIDSSVVVAALVDTGPTGMWAESVLGRGRLVAPHLMPVEVANILRRSVLAGEVSVDSASLALRDLQSLRVELFPFEPFATRVWGLRGGVTAYDGWYVALAEAVQAPLATLDRRLARSSGPTCEFLLSHETGLTGDH